VTRRLIADGTIGWPREAVVIASGTIIQQIPIRLSALAHDTCRKCGQPYTLMRAPRIEGVQGDVRAIFEDFPYLKCLQGHGGRFVYPDFGTELIGQVFENIPTWRWQGLVKRLALCGECGTPVDRSCSEPTRFQIPINLRDQYSFRIEIVTKTARCPSCRKAQVAPRDDAFSSDVADAMIAAFEQIGLWG